jgi:hypothetical protein
MAQRRRVSRRWQKIDAQSLKGRMQRWIAGVVMIADDEKS